MVGTHVIRFSLTLDDIAHLQTCTVRRVGAYVVTVSTIVPLPGCATEVHSTFVGHRATDTCVTHLVLGPGPGRRSVNTTRSNSKLGHHVDAASCVYDHLAVLLESLQAAGHDVRIKLPSAASALLTPA